MTRRQAARRRRTLYAAALRVLRRRYREGDLGVVEVAAELGCSTRQLQRVFREEGGTDFRSVLLAVRMKRARQLLSRRSRPLSIRKVARLVGYRQPSGLRQAFLRHWGVNPSTVRPPTVKYIGEVAFEQDVE
jgi:transcriptional regulator GlxA family with amidase domain